jgi:hypothetical protein
VSGLDKLTDDQLKKVQPRAAAVSPPPPATTTNQTPPVAAQTPAPVTPLTMDQLRQILPPSFFVVHEQGQMALNQAKSAYKQKIMADVNNKFSEAQLDAMDWQTLAAVAEMARPTAQVTTPPTAGPFLNGWTPNVMPFGGGGNWSGSQGPIPTAVGGNGVTNTVGTHEPLGRPFRTTARPPARRSPSSPPTTNRTRPTPHGDSTWLGRTTLSSSRGRSADTTTRPAPRSSVCPDTFSN